MRMALTYSTIVVITTKCLVNISIHYQTCQARSQESASLEMESNTALISRHAPVITKFREEIRNCKISYIYIKLTTQLLTYRGTSPSPIETTKYAENQLKKKKSSLWVGTLKCTMTCPIWRPIKQVTVAISELHIIKKDIEFRTKASY